MHAAIITEQDATFFTGGGGQGSAAQPNPSAWYQPGGEQIRRKKDKNCKKEGGEIWGNGTKLALHNTDSYDRLSTQLGTWVGWRCRRYGVSREKTITKPGPVLDHVSLFAPPAIPRHRKSALLLEQTPAPPPRASTSNRAARCDTMYLITDYIVRITGQISYPRLLSTACVLPSRPSPHKPFS